jgi:hypothetical protein
MTDETYEGMSIIIDQHKDIPLFKGLKPTRSEYIMKGNYWNEIYDFYLKELPKYGWKAEYLQKDENNDVPGFMSIWRKKGLDWELTIGGGFVKAENQTEVTFDKNPIHYATTWILNIPKSICIYQNSSDKNCSVIHSKSKIKEIVHFINDASDWNEEVSPRQKTSVIDTEELKINVLFGDDKEIYFQSEKGTKIMKPEPDFFTLTNLLP